jgi:transposase InsO family protein
VKLVGDITYIPTWQGWLYLATVIDCHSKAVVGWSTAVLRSSRMRWSCSGADLVDKARVL